MIRHLNLRFFFHSAKHTSNTKLFAEVPTKHQEQKEEGETQKSAKLMMNCSKQAERAEPLFQKAVTIDDIKMLIKILNQKLDVAIKAEFSFLNGDYTNVNTEEMLETKPGSYERVKKSKMSADAAEFIPMSHKIGFGGNGTFSRSTSLMKQLANTDRESLENVSYAFTNRNNSAGVKLSAEDSRGKSDIAKEDSKDMDENQDLNKENHFGDEDLETRHDVELHYYNGSLQTNGTEELKIPNERKLKIVPEDPLECEEPSDNDEVNIFQGSKKENMISCNDCSDKNQSSLNEEHSQTEPIMVKDFMPSNDKKLIFNSGNKNASALNKSFEENQDVAGRHSSEDLIIRMDEDGLISSPSNVREGCKKGVNLHEPLQENLIVVKCQKENTEPEIDTMLVGKDTVDEKEDRCEERSKNLQQEVRDEENIVAEFGQTGVSDCVEKYTSNGERKITNQNDDIVKNNLLVPIMEAIMEAIRCEVHPKETSLCKLFGEMLKEKCHQEIGDDDNDTAQNDSMELDIVPETIRNQWNSHLTNRMLAYSVHLRCSELANIYKTWSESTPPILPTKFWRTKKQNNYVMQSIAEEMSLVCLKCEVVQMKLEDEQQKLKYEEIDKMMQLSFEKESKNSIVQKKLEDSWRKAIKTEEMRLHKTWENRKNWFNVFAMFYQKPDAISKTFERVGRPFFSANRDRSRLFLRRAWRR